MLKELQLRQTNRAIDVLKHWSNPDSGAGLYLDPPYQRGDVWGIKRRRNLIRSVLLCVPIPSMIINERLFADWPDEDSRIAVIDGKQRITTILMFLDDKLSVPGNWFDSYQRSVVFSDLTQAQRRRFMNTPLPFSEGRLPDLEAEREVFDLVNFGGLRPGEMDEDLEE